MYDILKLFYDVFYAPAAMSEELKREANASHQALITLVGKQERKLILQIIDAKDRLAYEESLNGFMSGFVLAWQLSTELTNYTQKHPTAARKNSCTGADFVYMECD